MLCHQSFFQRLLQRTHKTAGAHVEVGTGRQRTGRTGLEVAAAPGAHLANRAIVGHHKPLEVPLLAQEAGQQPATGGGGLVVYRVERRHHAAHTGFYGRTVGSQVVVVHPHAAHVGHVVVQPRLRCSVKGEMLHAGHHLVGGVLFSVALVALVAHHHGLGHRAPQERVFAGALGDAAPTGVATDVDHRTINPGNAVGRGFDGRCAGGQLHLLQIPSARHGKGDGEDGVVAVDDIEAEQQRDAQA